MDQIESHFIQLYKKRNWQLCIFLSLVNPTSPIFWTLKFGVSDKHTKFEKIILMVLTNQLIYLVNVKTMRKIFFQFMCASQKVRTLQSIFEGVKKKIVD